MTLLLGHYTDYTIGLVTLRSGLQIIGSGNTAVTLASPTQTAAFVLPQDGTMVNYDHFRDFNLFASATQSVSQMGFDIDCGSETTGGWENSTIENMFLGQYGNPFTGNALRLACEPTGYTAVIQFNQINNVTATRANGSTNAALYIAGDVGNNQIYGGRFDAINSCDATVTPNVYIGENGGERTMFMVF